MIGIVDYGVGNLLAIQNIIQKAGGKSVISSDPSELGILDKFVLPGVGAFAYGLHQLHSRGLYDFLNEQVIAKKKTILGLCLGAQLMTQYSEEGDQKGFGWVNGSTVKFDSSRVPVIPHMNWGDVKFTRESLLTKGFETTPRFYFVHSFHFQFADSSEIIATSFYGYEFACAFQRDNIYGVQFHPEKSHRYGVQLFRNFINA